MIAWLLLLSVAALFIAINIIIGCYITIRLGYGPPDWKTALNLVVRVTTLQDRLNEGRDWIAKKKPGIDKFLNRLHVPKPIIIVEVPEETDDDEEIEVETEEKMEEDISDENNDIGKVKSEAEGEVSTEQTGVFASDTGEKLLDKLEPHASGPEQISPNETTDLDKDH